MSKSYVTMGDSAANKSLQVSRDCVSFIKSLFSQVVATRAPELNRYAAQLVSHETQ